MRHNGAHSVSRRPSKPHGVDLAGALVHNLDVPQHDEAGCVVCKAASTCTRGVTRAVSLSASRSAQVSFGLSLHIFSGMKR